VTQPPTPSSAQSPPTASANTLATTSMMLGIVVFCARLFISPLISTFLLHYQRSELTQADIGIRMALASIILSGLGSIAGLLITVLGFVSLERGRGLPPSLSRRDHGVVAIVLGFAILAGVLSSWLATVYPMLMAGFF